MIIKSATLETVCGITSVLPINDKPEMAFSGKSNVGKSSLINALMNRKSLARISTQPGKTQTINYYNINDKLYFVDLPGYGYAKVAVAVKEKWGKMIENYLKTSRQLKIIFLLLDIRHEPSENDKSMYDWIVYQGFQPVIIATKLDKIKRSQKDKQVKIIKVGLQAVPGTIIIPFSANTKQGRDEIWELIDSYCSFPVEENKVIKNQVEMNQVEDNQIEMNQVEEKQFEENQVEENKIEMNQVEENQVEENQFEENQVEDNQAEEKQVIEKQVIE